MRFCFNDLYIITHNSVMNDLCQNIDKTSIVKTLLVSTLVIDPQENKKDKTRTPTIGLKFEHNNVRLFLIDPIEHSILLLNLY